MARTISVEIVGDASSLQKSFRGASRSARVFENDITRSARGAAAASLSFHGLGRAAAYASGYLIGGAGLALGLKAVTKAAIDHQSEEKQLQAAIKAGGDVYRTQAAAIQKNIHAQESLGFTEDAATKSFVALYRATGSVQRAQQLQATAANLARGRNMDLQAATLLVVKANAGMTGSIRRLLPFIDKHATATQILAALNQKYAGAAGAFAKSAAGEQMRLSIAIHATEIAIGTALLPTITKYSAKLADWLDQSKNQERIQRDVNHVMATASAIFKGVGTAVRTVDRATGSFKNTLVLLLALKVGSVLTGWAVAFRRTGGSAAAASLEVNTLGAKLRTLATLAPIVITVDILTRLIPHKVTAGGQKILNQEGLGFLGHAPLGIGHVVQAGAYAGRNAAKAAGLYQGGGPSNVPPQFSTSVQLREAYLAGKQGNAYPFNLAAMDAGPLLAAYLAGRKMGPKPVGTAKAAPSTNTAFKTKPPAVPLDRQSQIQDAVSQARLAVARDQTGSQAKLVAALKAEIDFDAKYAAIQQKLAARGGKDAKKHAQAMQQLLGDESSAYDEIRAMTAKTAKKEAAAAKKKTEAAKKAAEAAKKAAEAIARAAQAQKQAFQQAVDSAKGIVGDLGQGPVATGASAQFMQQYGGHLTAKAFTQDLEAQNRQGSSFLKNLNKLRRRGGSSALIQTLLQQGQGGMDEAAALAGASKAQLAVFLKDYGRRQKLLTQVAKMEVHTPKVMIEAKTVHVGRTEAHDRGNNKFGRTGVKGGR